MPLLDVVTHQLGVFVVLQERDRATYGYLNVSVSYASSKTCIPVLPSCPTSTTRFGSRRFRDTRASACLHKSCFSVIDKDRQLRSTEDLLSLGNSLIIISSAENKVNLAHLSVRDYLLSESLASDPRVEYFALAPKRSQSELAADCLTYLFFDELSSVPCESADDYMERLEK